jgi:hypothetical protein
MAQAGYTPISLYYSSTTTNVPLNTDLVAGELAINITDGKLFYKDNANVVQVIGTKGGVGSTSNTQVLFNNSGAIGGSANLTWNGTTIAVTGALTATADSTFSSTGALTISKGTSIEQPGSPVTGMLRYNTTSNQFEGYSGSSPAWNPVGGATLANDTSTATNVYPLFANATSGSATTVYTSNAKLLYKPSTGELQATAVVASNGIFVNSQAIAADYTIAATDNGGSFGPVTVNSGITVTVSSGAVWTVV